MGTSSSCFGSKVYARWASPALAWLPLPLRATGRVCRPYNALYRSCTVQCTTTACDPPSPLFHLGPFFSRSIFVSVPMTLYIGDVEPPNAASLHFFLSLPGSTLTVMVACRSRLFTLCGLCVRHLELDHTGANHFHRLYVFLGGLDTRVRIRTLCRLFPLLFFFFWQC
uniref:Putative serine/threonine protein phosphatase pp1 n=1 Tax=Ixodes scapularis TaxID=6945 RepID=A0A4D5RE72_IXOSC